MIEATSALPPLGDAARLRANSAASWGAILAGSVVAVSLSVILLTLGAGLGFASISPWSDHGLSARAFTVAGTIWLIVTQWLSAAAGGYIAGRLRHRWPATHVHEVFFRDTAHGLVTWAVATLLVATILASSTTSLLGGGAHALGGLAAAGAQGIGAMGRREMPGAGDPLSSDWVALAATITLTSCFVAGGQVLPRIMARLIIVERWCDLTCLAFAGPVKT